MNDARGASVRADWDYLETGILIKTPFGELRLDEPDEDLELFTRHPLCACANEAPLDV
jgi:hypothetical protein